MTSLTSLPGELLDRIFSDVRNTDSGIKDLAALSGTCRLLQISVEPQLYRQIQFIGDGYDAPPIYLLVRTLLNRKILARHIQSIHLRKWHRTRTPRATVMKRLTSAEIDKLHEQREDLSRSYPTRWTQGLNFCKTDFFAAVLVSQCHRLRSLSLDFHYGASNSLVGMILSVYQYKHKIYPWLKEFEVVNEDVPTDEIEPCGEAIIDIHHLSVPFAVPSVEIIKASNITKTPFDLPLRPSLPLNLLRILKIEGARCDERNVEHVLSSCPALRELTWERECDCHFDESCQPDCRALYRGLLHVKDTIESVRISIHFYASTSLYYTLDGLGTLQGRLGSLSSFAKLRRLHVPFALLFGWAAHDVPRLFDILPPNLESLSVSDDTHEEKENYLFVRLPLNRLIEYLYRKVEAATSHKENRLINSQIAASLDSHSFTLRRLYLCVRSHEWVRVAEHIGLKAICESLEISYEMILPSSYIGQYERCREHNWETLLEEYPVIEW